MKANEFKWGISLPLCNNMEVSRAAEKITLQNARESKTANYPVQEPETFSCCFDSLNSAPFSLSLPIFQLASLHLLLFWQFYL